MFTPADDVLVAVSGGKDSLALWEGVLGQYGIGPRAAEKGEGGPALPRKAIAAHAAANSVTIALALAFG